MTDRFNALVVALDNDIREDDAQVLTSAIKQLRGVLSVEGHVASIDSMVAQERARQELSGKLWDVLYPKKT
jgi:hypothetical protein